MASKLNSLLKSFAATEDKNLDAKVTKLYLDKQHFVIEKAKAEDRFANFDKKIVLSEVVSLATNSGYKPKPMSFCFKNFNYSPLTGYTTDYINNHRKYKNHFKDDTIKFIEILKYLSSISWADGENIDKMNHNLYYGFYIKEGTPSDKIIKLYLKKLSKMGNQNVVYSNNVSDLPLVGHFGLYNSSKGSNKAPRIHFVYTGEDVITLMLYDPFHEIHPV